MPVVLIVDDNLERMSTLGDPLESSGQKVHYAHSVPSAFLIVQEQHVDMILLSLAQSDEEGIEAFCRLADRLPFLILHSPAAAGPESSASIREGALLLPTEKLVSTLESYAADKARKSSLEDLVPILARHSI